MTEQNVPQFSEEAGREFSELLEQFLEKHLYKNLSEEERSCVEVEIKLKPQNDDLQAREAPSMFTIFGCRCMHGHGFGCGPGFHIECGPTRR